MLILGIFVLCLKGLCIVNLVFDSVWVSMMLSWFLLRMVRVVVGVSSVVCMGFLGFFGGVLGVSSICWEVCCC